MDGKPDEGFPFVFFGREPPPVRDVGGRLPVAVVFPEKPALGLSTLGWQVVFGLLWRNSGLAPERVFLERVEDKPRAFDSGRPLGEFPLIAASLNFELDLPPFFQALASAGIAPRRADRQDWPLVLAGGPLAFMNPAPMAPGVDAFFVGEAEAGLAEVVEAVREGYFAGRDKRAVLERVAGMPGVYAPGMSRAPVRRVAVSSGVGPAAACFVSSQAEFRDMLLLEVNRGCPYGCRFCAAGFVYRPPRHADMAGLLEIVERAAARTSLRKVGLVGTALTDWPELVPFLRELTRRGVGFGLSSLRADGLTEELLATLRAAGTRSLTLALEGASERLRRAANKRLDPADLFKAVERAARLGFNTLKLYLILGWPGETEADYLELADLCRELDAVRRASAKKGGLSSVIVGASGLVPKPWTPMQWAPMASEAALKEAAGWLKRAVQPLKGWRAEVDQPAQARMQGLIARGGEDLFDLILDAGQRGLRAALREWPQERIAAVLDRESGKDESFPWEVIDPGVSRAYLWREWLRYQDAMESSEAPRTPLCPDAAINTTTQLCPDAASGGCEACRDRCGAR